MRHKLFLLAFLISFSAPALTQRVTLPASAPATNAIGTPPLGKNSATQPPVAASSASIPATSSSGTNLASVSPWALITASGALFAFLIGLFTLVARERKAPYLINTFFPIVLVAMAGVAFDAIAAALTPTSLEFLIAIGAGLLFLIVAIILSAWRVYKIYVRFALFVDSPHVKHWPIAKVLSNRRKSSGNKLNYEWDPIKIADDFLVKIQQTLSRHANWEGSIQNDKTPSAALAIEHQGQANEVLSELALMFLESNYCVQYLSTARHPIEFFTHFRPYVIEKKGEEFWRKKQSSIVAVDAYTPHFGYTDSIYYKATRGLGPMGVESIQAESSYAGLHTASSVAFNLLRERASSNNRDPALVIYEDCIALADLESIEQYRIFVRHVIPSERMWGGMFTLFVETSPSSIDWNLLKSYVGTVLDARNKVEAPLPQDNKP